MENLADPWTVSILVAASVGILAFWGSNRIFDQQKLRQRYAATPAPSVRVGSASPKRPTPLNLADVGMDRHAKQQLRMQMIRAGHFGPQAPAIYTLVRTAIAVVLPIAAYLLIESRLTAWGTAAKLGLAAGAFLTAYYIGQAYLDRRRRLLEARHRLFFPDFLDMLVVCVDAGLSLEAALERVARDLGDAQPVFRTNLDLMMAEMRAGKTTIEAFRHFADRLGLIEAAALVTLLQQSLELGTDVSAALEVFGQEMRDKRMSRAEEKAMALPVKMTIPLALFILPTVFIAILTPAGIKIATTFSAMVK